MNRRNWPKVYRLLVKCEPIMRLWVPTWFRSRVVYGAVFPSKWKRLLMAVSEEARREAEVKPNVDAPIYGDLEDADEISTIN